jgi:circadian clock protein KaiC
MTSLNLMPTGVPNLDLILSGGVPIYSLNILAGQPGTGKTILAQQILFNHVRMNPDSHVLYLVTLSEPAVKVVRYMQQFTFFNAELFNEQVHYKDIGSFIRKHTLNEITDHILALVEDHQPDILMIDSFRAIRDLARDIDTFRRFCYDLSIRLISARCTTFLIGEYDRPSIAEGLEFATADGILYLDMAYHNGEEHRFLQIYKLRGRQTSLQPFPFIIKEDGIHILSASLTLQRQHIRHPHAERRLSTGIPGLDLLLRGGIMNGRSIIVSGVSGTGKTTFGLQFLAHGAMQGERGLLFSFEEEAGRLRAMALEFGWDLAKLEQQGFLKIVFISQTDIRVEENIEHMIELIAEFQPQRFVIDSFSVLLHRITDAPSQREKSFQIANLVRFANAVGVLISDIPSGHPNQLSRFGVEETVMDGTIVLSTEILGLKRKRYLEVVKMRASNHITGRHRIEITTKGIEVFYRQSITIAPTDTPPPLAFEPVKTTIRGDLRHGLAWLIQGEAGGGKSTLAYQFAIEGLQRKETVLFLAADVPVYQVRQSMQNLGFLPDPYLESGQLVILDAFGGGTESLDLSDPDALIFTIMHQLEQMPRPTRKIFDSLTTQGLSYHPQEFVALVHRKNRVIRQPGVTMLDTLPHDVLERSNLNRLLNAYDVILDLYTPDWGAMGTARGNGQRVIQVSKALTGNVDTRPYPYRIVPGTGIVIQRNFYRQSDE